MDSNFRFRASSDYAGVGVSRSTWAVLTLRRHDPDWNATKRRRDSTTYTPGPVSLYQHIERCIFGRSPNLPGGRAIVFEAVPCERHNGHRGPPCVRLVGRRHRRPAWRPRHRGQACSASAAASRAALSSASWATLASREALSSAVRASRATLTAWRAACRATNAGSFTPDLARNFSSSAFFAFAAALSRSSKLVPLRLRISLRLCEDPSDGSGCGGKTTLGDDATLAGEEHRRPLHEPARQRVNLPTRVIATKFRICH
jgi:hypothetical protein